MTKHARILVVEDEMIVARDIQVRLDRLGYTVIGLAATSADALALVDQQKPDLVLMDIRLQGEVDGIATADQIRQRFHIPVIYLTAHADEATVTRASLTEPFGYILKPFEERELDTLIEIGLYKHRADKRLRESERRYATTLSSIGDAVIATDAQGKVTFMNPVAEQLVGRGWREAAGQRLVDVFRIVNEETRQVVENPVERVLRDGVVVGLANHTILMAWDGRELPIDDCASPIFDDRGVCTGAVLVFRDVTQARRMEEELLQSQKMEAIGRLAGGVAHDFNNILTVISGYSSLLLDSMPEDHPWRGFISEIHVAGRRAADLTRQLLAFSRREMVQPRILDLNHIVGNVQKMLRRLIPEHIELRLSLEPTLGGMKADPGQIEQVILNLAINARDAMVDGGTLTLETSNIVFTESDASKPSELPEGVYRCLRVIDTGVGMDESTRRRIFEPFYTTKDQSKGTGLGLATVYGIVGSTGGHVNVESKLGEGSCFTIYFPGVQEIAPTQAGMAVQHLPKGTETILLAEDEDGVRNFCLRVLQLAGYTVLEAANGIQALDRSEQYTGSIDLLLTDIIMPEMNGRILAERISKDRPGIKVLCISGYTDNSLLQGIEEKGFHFLRKPFTPLGLTEKLRQILGT